MRPDSWLKVEVLSVVSAARRAGGVRDARTDRQGCDVWFSTADGEHWLATRGLITSYAGPGREARPTIASVEEVAREMDKLNGLATLSGGSAALLLAAFPFGPEPRERSEWAAQMLRFEAKGFTVIENRTLPLGAQREGRLYLFR